MKIGKTVAVCHDGKWGRRVKGTVVGTKNGYRIKVRFRNPDTGEDVEFWFRKRPTIHYRKEVFLRECFSVIYMECYAHYDGWVDINWFMPYFSVHKWRG